METQSCFVKIRKSVFAGIHFFVSPAQIGIPFEKQGK